MTSSGSDDVVVRALDRPGDLGWVVMAHGLLYDAEFGWDLSFEALVASIVSDYARRRDDREAAWIAELDGVRVGCVFCTAKDATTAQLRILLVDPSARGRGIGARLIRECLTFAEHAGYDVVMLWTNDVLVAARHLYEEAGFVRTAREEHHSFGHRLVGEYWIKALDRAHTRGRGSAG